jgi:hypothetical protein
LCQLTFEVDTPLLNDPKTNQPFHNEVHISELYSAMQEHCPNGLKFFLIENGILKCMNFTDSQQGVVCVVNDEKKMHDKIA